MELSVNKTKPLIQDEPASIVINTIIEPTGVLPDTSTEFNTIKETTGVSSETFTEINTITELISDEISEQTSTFELILTTSSAFTCFSELFGYSCCPPGAFTIYATDEYGDWSYDFSKNK